jgi:RNA polymerase sigma-70 factor (ECF subfamily)
MADSLKGHWLRLFSPSDEQAMLRVQKEADSQAFALLVRRWERPIQRLCTRMTGSAHRGEELAQETFARLFERRSQYRHDAPFSTYLWRIAVNLCCNEHRATRWKEPGRERNNGKEENSLPSAARELPPDAVLVARERAELVRNALAQLSEAYRSVLMMRHYEGLKFREIAEVLEIPEGTVKSRMAEGLTQLARLLGPRLRE